MEDTNDIKPLPLSKNKRRGGGKIKFSQHCVDEDLTEPHANSSSNSSGETSKEERMEWRDTFSRAYMCSYDGKWDSTDDYMFVIKRCTNQDSIMKKFLKTSNISQVKISPIHYIILSTDDCVAESNPEQKVNRMLLICKDRHGAEIHTLYQDACDFPNLLIEYSKEMQAETEISLEREEVVAKPYQKCEFKYGGGACKCDGCLAEFKHIDTLYDYAHGCLDKM